MEKLHLGVSRRIITPSVGCCLFGYRPDLVSESVEDDLTVTSFYFSQGEKKALMVSVTVGLIADKLYERIIDRIEKEFSLPRQNCMISATHTHSGPDTAGMAGWGEMDEEYIGNIFIPRIMQSVAEAMENTEPVTVGYACGESFAGINRRETRQGRDVVLGQDPDGVFDPRMTVISFKNEAGEITANIIHYACHGTSAGANREITRDWHGVMTDELESVSSAVTAFFNGTDGDAGPRLSSGKTLSDGEIEYIYEIGRIGAKDAVRIFGEIDGYRDVELICGGADVGISLKPRISLEQAKAIDKMYDDNAINYEQAIKNYARQIIKEYENGVPEQKEMPFLQCVIALGDIVLVSFPFELFAQIGLHLDGSFANRRILPLSHTNGAKGYFITENEKSRGGYEVDMYCYGEKTQQYVDNADSELLQKSVKNISETLKKGE